METIYVTIEEGGSYEDKWKRIVYAGLNEQEAIEKGKICFHVNQDINMPINGDINSIYVEHWIDGKHIQDVFLF